jgi:hypothetical protein
MFPFSPFNFDCFLLASLSLEPSFLAYVFVNIAIFPKLQRVGTLRKKKRITKILLPPSPLLDKPKQAHSTLLIFFPLYYKASFFHFSGHYFWLSGVRRPFRPPKMRLPKQLLKIKTPFFPKKSPLSNFISCLYLIYASLCVYF